MSKWISVDDEMPDKYIRVLVAFTFDLPMKYRMPLYRGKKRMSVTTGYVDKYNMFRLNESMSTYRNVAVRYWMPFPDPPED